MPFGDGTGPNGDGPMTGRGAGYCAGADRPGIGNRRYPGRLGGRHYGWGSGGGYGVCAMGFGMGRGFNRRGLGYGR